MPATTERWRLVERVLDGALEMDDALRAEYLGRACRGDPALRAEVETWLRWCRKSGGFLDVSADRFALPLVHPAGCGTRNRGTS